MLVGWEGVLATSECWGEEVLIALSFFLVDEIALTTLCADDV